MHQIISLQKYIYILSETGNAKSSMLAALVGAFGAIFSFSRPPRMSKTCRGSILPQRSPELGRIDSDIINRSQSARCTGLLLMSSTTPP